MLMFVWRFLFLNQVYGLKMDKVSLSCYKKIGHFGPLWSKIWPFLHFWLFSWKPRIRILCNLFFITSISDCFKLYLLDFWSLDFSSWGLWIHARPFVRSFFRPSHSISRKPRIRFWWFFAQSYILMSLKKCSNRILKKNSRFRDFGQKWPIFAIFGHF